MQDRITRRHKFFLLPLLIWTVTSGVDSCANERVSGLQKRLQRQVSMTWKGQTLHGALAGLSDHQQLCVWLDRRVDPDQSVELALRNVSLKQAFEELAGSCNLHVAYLANVIYLGPDDAAWEIMALGEKLHQWLEHLPSSLRQHWFHKSAWSWPRLSEPRDLLKDLFSATPIRIHDVEHVPYDLWDARQLPGMTRVDQAILLLIGFNLTLQIGPDGKYCRVVPIEHPVVFTRQYSFRENQASEIARLKRQFPELNIEPGGAESSPRAFRVTGAWPAQQKFRRALKSRSSLPHEQGSQRPGRPVLQDQQVYSLEIREQTLRNVLQQLASQLPVELTWDERQLTAAGHSLDTRISCKVQSASLEQLLEAVLTPVGLHYRRKGRQIRIQAEL